MTLAGDRWRASMYSLATASEAGLAELTTRMTFCGPRPARAGAGRKSKSALKKIKRLITKSSRMRMPMRAAEIPLCKHPVQLYLVRYESCDTCGDPFDFGSRDDVRNGGRTGGVDQDRSLLRPARRIRRQVWRLP